MEERIAVFVMDNMSMLIFLIFGLFVPGGLSLLILKKEYYIKLNVVKILFLSFIISAPTLGYYYLILSIILISYQIPVGEMVIPIASVLNMISFSVSQTISVLNSNFKAKDFLMSVITMCALLTVCLLLFLDNII